MSLRNMKIGLRAGICFAALATLLVLLGVITLSQMQRMDSMSDAIETKWFPSTLALNDLGVSAMRVRALTLRFYALDTDQARRAALPGLDATKADLASAQSRYLALVESDAERLVFEQLLGIKDRYLQHQSEAVELMLRGERMAAGQILTGVMAEEGDLLVRKLKELTEYNRQGATQAFGESDEVYEHSTSTVVLVVIVATVLTILLAIYLTRSIVKPLGRAVEVAKTIAAGDLTGNVDDHGRDEPAQLLQALAAMQRSLRDTLQRIGESSNQLASSSEELHAVTEDATRGLHLQNEEIEQAATAVNQMTATVEEVAQNAVSTSKRRASRTRPRASGRIRCARPSIPSIC